MGAIASQITSLTIVYASVYSGADQSKHQSSASLAFVWGIHRGPMNSPHKWPVTRKMFPFDDVIMLYTFQGDSHLLQSVSKVVLNIAVLPSWRSPWTGTYRQIENWVWCKVTLTLWLLKLIAAWCIWIIVASWRQMVELVTLNWTNIGSVIICCLTSQHWFR